jgi:RecJ-like exonuclease
MDVGGDTDDCRVFNRVSFRTVKGGISMRDEELKIEAAECEGCEGRGYMCECERNGKVYRTGSEDCDYCSNEIKISTNTHAIVVTDEAWQR